ncbi:hypothetical protein [Brevibacillus reuszeri]|uniref:hypothetical protein n=1 Tax=Brevibacillus reuszeri TaxID=54915 RepID=UPI003D1EA94C
MKNKRKIIYLPLDSQLPHYSEIIDAETKRRKQFIQEVQERAEEIKKRIKKRDKE